MNERIETGGHPGATPRLFVAVRSMDRRQYISPTKAAPDLFEVPVTPQTMSIETRVNDGMKAEHGFSVKPDYRLDAPLESPNISAMAVFHHSTVDYTKAGEHGHFTPHEVNETYHQLHDWSLDAANFTEAERRLFKVKAHLFRQVLHLFSNRGARRPN